MYSKTILVGHIGRDAEQKYTAKGTPVVNFSMATNRKWKKDGELQEQTEWHKIVFWGERAEKLCQYLQKGKLILVEGRYTTRKWQDRDGNDRYTSELVVDNLTLLSQRGGEEGERRQEEESHEPFVRPMEEEDDIPF